MKTSLTMTTYKAAVFFVLVIVQTMAAHAAPDPQEADKRICIQEWDKTKATVESLLQRKLNMNANRIADQCADFWTTPEQKGLLAKIRGKNVGRDEALKKEQADYYDRQAALSAKQRKHEGVAVGMTTEQVLQSSWGKPLHINRTTNANGTHEQWVYPGGRNYLYFDGGLLTSIQN